MASLINSAGATGTGTMTLQGPNTNSNQVLTIPDTTGTMMVSGNMPAFSAYMGNNQSISNSTFTKVQFNTKTFDTNSNYDATTNYRFTPTVAGYYQCNVTINTQTSANTTLISIYKNNSSYLSGLQLPSTVFQVGSMSALIYMNGTTDYLEVFFYGGATTLNAGSGATQFSAAMVRAA